MNRLRQQMCDIGNVLADRAPLGPAYEAEKTLRRLKYLDALLCSTGARPETLHEARCERAQIMDAIPD